MSTCDARRAGDDLELALAQAHELQQLGADLDFLHRRGGQGDPDRVADALGEQRAEGGAGLDGALEGGAGLGHPQVQGPVAPLGQQLVGLDHGDHVVVLDRDLEVVEAALLEQARLPGRGLVELIYVLAFVTQWFVYLYQSCVYIAVGGEEYYSAAVLFGFGVCHH